MENGEDAVAMDQQQQQQQDVDGVEQVVTGGVEELHSPTKASPDHLQPDDSAERTCYYLLVNMNVDTERTIDIGLPREREREREKCTEKSGVYTQSVTLRQNRPTLYTL